MQTHSRIGLSTGELMTGLPYEPARHGGQFNHILFCRLSELSPIIRHKISVNFAITSVPINGVSTLPAGSLTAIVGVVYVEYPKKPNVLTEISGQKTPDNWKEGYTIYLEDETAKIEVDRKLCDHTAAVTGLVMGIVGYVHETGLMVPVHVVYPGIAPVRANPGASKQIICLCDIPRSRMKLDMLKAAISSDAMRDSVFCEFHLSRLERFY